jgi:hypothetical protein
VQNIIIRSNPKDLAVLLTLECGEGAIAIRFDAAGLSRAQTHDLLDVKRERYHLATRI